MTTKYNFKIYKGSDQRKRLRFIDSNKQPYSVADYSASMQIRQSSSTKAIDTLTTENGRITKSSDGTELILNFPHEVTSAYVIDKTMYGVIPYCVYDLKLTDTETEDVRQVMHGQIRIQEEITRV